MAVIALAGCICPARTPTVYHEARELSGRRPLFVLGDLQSTSWAEEHLLGREENSAERERLLTLLQEQDPSAILLLGDAVFRGASPCQWAELDSLLDPVRNREFLFVPGNHDLWGDNASARHNLAQRFAHRLPRVVPWGEATVLLLDSNRADMSERAWQEQLRFARRVSSVSPHLIVALHHPPQTNSAVTGDDSDSAELVSAISESNAPVLVLAGHSHSYEHFRRGGTHYVVSGGAGGPRVLLHGGSDARHPDLFAGDSPRPFHFLRVSQDPNGLRVTAIGFWSNTSAAGVFDTFVIPWRR